MIEERQYKLLQFELDDRRAIANSLRNKNTRLTHKVEKYREAMIEIYQLSLDHGKHKSKLELIKEICRRYKIPKKPDSEEERD